MGGGGTPDLSRVVVVGTSCSGKTTFARDLAAILQTAHVEQDALYWLPGWGEREPDEYLALIEQKTACPRWVTDGNYAASRDLLLSQATAIIWLDCAFPLVLWRCLKRSIRLIVTGQEICNGNVETFRVTFFSRRSIILWVITTFRERKRTYGQLFSGDGYPGAVRIRLSSPGAAKAFLASIPPA